MRFETPLALCLLVFLPVVMHELLPFGAFGIRRAIAFCAPALIRPLPLSGAARTRRFCKVLLRALVFLLVVLALARPQTGNARVEVRASGRDLLLVLDVSGSMEAMDFTINNQRSTRLEALKRVTRQFLEARGGDRLGIIVFGDQVYTLSPLTLDHTLVADLIDTLEVGMAGDGTALGDSIAVSLQRIESIEENSKVLVLVTDGMRTAGQLNPLEAAELAKKLGVKIYTIGIGGKGPAPFATPGLFGRRTLQYQNVPLDEETLSSIAELTGASYFNATSTEELEKIYAELDALEPREEIRNEFVEYQERFAGIVSGAALLLILYTLLHLFVWPELP